MTNFKGLVKRLTTETRKTPEQYRLHVLQNVTDPQQLSERTISEYYDIPNARFRTTDDVFQHRGYKKLEKIDEGAFGLVSKAIRLSDKVHVAVKEIDLRKRRAKRVEEMKRELFVLQKVSHDTVVALYEHFIVGQTLVIIMEYLAGSNLTLFLRDNSLNEQEAMNLFRQMATSIRVLHKKGIAHRDIKLNNFLLDSSHTIIKIADFGLSVVSFRPRRGILMAKTYCGTEPYMAPELFKRNHLNARSYNPLYADIWSLGVCLFAMLTRTFPFRANTDQDVLFRLQLMRKWRFPKSFRGKLTDDLKDLVWHMLDPEPERRVTMNGVVAHPWVNRNQFVALTVDDGENSATTSGMKSSTKNALKSATTSATKSSTKNALKSATTNALKSSTKHNIKSVITNAKKSSAKNALKSSTTNILKSSTKHNIKSVITNGVKSGTKNNASVGKNRVGSIIRNFGSRRSSRGAPKADQDSKSHTGSNSNSTSI